MNNKPIELETGKLYIISGSAGSGKSHFLQNIKNIQSEMIVSSDDIRKKMFGVDRVILHNKPAHFLPGWVIAQEKTIEIMKLMVEARLRENLTCFVDMMNLTDADRSVWVELAKKSGVDFEVLILNPNVDKVIEQNNARDFRVSQQQIKNNTNSLQLHSQWQYRMVNAEQNFVLTPKLLPWNEGKWDVIGDVHGLLSELKSMLKKMGYQENENGEYVHPEGRHLIFLGDYVDRGQESVPLLQWMKVQVERAGHLALLGNHETKQIRWFKKWKKDGEFGVLKGFGPMETLHQMLLLGTKERESLLNFLKNLPSSLKMDVPNQPRLALGHANNVTIQDIEDPKSKWIYGFEMERGQDTDKEYESFFEQGINKHIFIRGHIPQTSDQEHVFSLEQKQAYGGFLVALPLDKWISRANLLGLRGSFNENIIKEKCDFNFDVHVQKRRKLEDNLTKLVSEGWVEMKENKKFVLKLWSEKVKEQLNQLKNKKWINSKKENGSDLEIWKYSHEVFFNQLWNQDEKLKKARGLVTNAAGDIVQHPFDKVFNLGEGGTGLNIHEDAQVIWVEKLNGFLGCVTAHPYQKESDDPRDRLLCTTTGSFDSDFVQMIKKWVSKETAEFIASYCEEQKDVTFMFEVIDLEDPHIVKYEEKDQGIYLIGMRGKEVDAPLATEKELDEVAEKMGVKRPSWEIMTWESAKKKAKECKNLEGGMIRDAQTQETLLKMKSPWYMSTKFIARMNHGNQTLMFKNPNLFKQKIDEEFEYLVDLVTENTTLDEFKSWSSEEKVKRIAHWVDSMQGNFFNSTSQIKAEKNKKFN